MKTLVGIFGHSLELLNEQADPMLPMPCQEWAEKKLHAFAGSTVRFKSHTVYTFIWLLNHILTITRTATSVRVLKKKSMRAYIMCVCVYIAEVYMYLCISTPVYQVIMPLFTHNGTIYQ